MIQALVADCNECLPKMEKTSSDVEAHMAQGASDEVLREGTQELCKAIQDYKNAAKFCKKHLQKPKPKGKAAAKAEAAPASAS